MADLYDVGAGVLLVGGAHALGMIHRERHGLFLIDVLAGGEGVGEVLAVQVLRGGDEDGVQVLVVEQAMVVQVGPGAGRDRLHGLERLGVHVGGAHTFHVGQGDSLLEDLAAAIANADDADADALVGAQDIGRGQRASQTGGDVTDEITARLHGDTTPGLHS